MDRASRAIAERKDEILQVVLQQSWDDTCRQLAALREFAVETATIDSEIVEADLAEFTLLVASMCRRPTDELRAMFESMTRFTSPERKVGCALLVIESALDAGLLDVADRLFRSLSDSVADDCAALPRGDARRLADQVRNWGALIEQARAARERWPSSEPIPGRPDQKSS